MHFHPSGRRKGKKVKGRSHRPGINLHPGTADLLAPPPFALSFLHACFSYPGLAFRPRASPLRLDDLHRTSLFMKVRNILPLDISQLELHHISSTNHSRAEFVLLCLLDVIPSRTLLLLSSTPSVAACLHCKPNDSDQTGFSTKLSCLIGQPRRLRTSDLLYQMAAVTMAPGLPISRSRQDLHTLSTLPDPRSSRPSPAISRSPSVSPPHHPDLTDEVASLSNKLITAINHQTTLDDTLSDTRHDLDSAQDRVRQLEAQVQQHERLVADGVLVNRKELEDDTMKLMADLAGERKKRSAVEKEKKSIEIELESLTTALFEEANEVRCSLSLHMLTANLRRWLLLRGRSVKMLKSGMNSSDHSSTIPSYS